MILRKGCFLFMTLLALVACEKEDENSEEAIEARNCSLIDSTATNASISPNNNGYTGVHSLMIEMPELENPGNSDMELIITSRNLTPINAQVESFFGTDSLRMREIYNPNTYFYEILMPATDMSMEYDVQFVCGDTVQSILTTVELDAPSFCDIVNNAPNEYIVNNRLESVSTNQSTVSFPISIRPSSDASPMRTLYIPSVHLMAEVNLFQGDTTTVTNLQNLMSLPSNNYWVDGASNVSADMFNITGIDPNDWPHMYQHTNVIMVNFFLEFCGVKYPVCTVQWFT